MCSLFSFVRGVSRLVGKVAGDVDPAAIVRGTKSKAYPKGMTRPEGYDAAVKSGVYEGELDRANPFNIFGMQYGDKSWAGAPRNQKDLTPAARLIRAVIGARIYQRDIGSVKSGKIMDLDRELSMLQQELERVSSIRNPAQFQHIQYLIAHALDELSKLGPVQRGTITPKR